MLNILIVADNNFFIRKIYGFLVNNENIITRAVFNSNEIFNAYLRYKPEIIILDNELLIPISTVIEHFNDYKWLCSFLVVKSPSSNALHLPELNYIEPTKSSLYRGIQNYYQNVNAMTENYVNTLDESIYSGHYNMMVSFKTSSSNCALDPYILSQFKSEVVLLGNYEVYTYDGCNFLILIPKNTMQVPFKRIHNLICKYFNENYASIYDENIYHTRLYDVSQTLTQYQSICYFLSSQCISVDEINEINKNRTHIDVYHHLLKTIDYIFNSNYKMIESTIHHLYLSKIKTSLSLDSLNELHNWLHFFNSTIFKNFQLPPFDFIENRTNIEAELDKVQVYFYNLTQQLDNTPLPNIVTNCTLLLLKSFDNSDISLGYLETSIGFSKPYISRTFSQFTGTTIIEFLQKIRIETSRNLLETTDLAINQIALRVGFNDAQYLSKLFNKQIGIYPTAYRDVSKKEKPNACICQKFQT